MISLLFNMLSRFVIPFLRRSKRLLKSQFAMIWEHKKIKSCTSIHDYWKNHRLDYMDFVGKVIPLFFNTLFRFVMAFLPRSKCLLVSWLQPLSAVILEPKKIKSLTVAIVSTSICHELMGPDAMIFIF